MTRILLVIGMIACFSSDAIAKKPPTQSARTKFYDFSEMLIDGEIKKPTALYTDVRKRARFDRLLKLKKSFIGPLMNTAREKVFK